MQTREQWHEKIKGKEGLLKVNTINAHGAAQVRDGAAQVKDEVIDK